MDIETLALRLEEIKLNRLEVLEEKKVLAEELLDGRLKIELKKEHNGKYVIAYTVRPYLK